MVLFRHLSMLLSAHPGFQRALALPVFDSGLHWARFGVYPDMSLMRVVL
jgi:hypothetical protein